MRHWLCGLLAWGVAMAWLPAAAADVVFGVYPYLSASQIVDHYRLLRDRLSDVLGRPVTMVSAPDFTAFIDRTRAGDYDIVFTAPHMGRLAETRDGWQRLVQTGYQIEIVALVRRDSGIDSLADLRGKTIAIGSVNSMTYQIIDRALEPDGLALGREVKVLETASFSNVLQAIIRGEADAGATSNTLWQTAPGALHDPLRKIFVSAQTPGFLMLAHPRLGAGDIARLRDALVAFKDTPEGAAFFAKTRHIDFRLIDDVAMARIDPYTAVLIRPR